MTEKELGMTRLYMLKFFKLALIIITISVAGFLYFYGDVQAADTEITFGSKYDFNMASTSRIFATDLSLSKFVVVYQDGGAAFDQGTAIIGDVSGNTIIYGSEYAFNLADTDYLSVTALSDSKFVVVYQDGAASVNQGVAIIGDISGNVITYGSKYIFSSANTDNLSVAALSDSKFVIGYKNNEAGLKQGKAIIGDVSGNVITYGSEYVFNTANTDNIFTIALSDSKFAIAYQDKTGNLNYGTAIIGNVSGNAITYGSKYIFNPTDTGYISSVLLSEIKFAIVYQDGGGSLNYGRAIIGDVSGNVITYGLEYAFNTGATSYVSGDMLSENKFVVSYQGNSGLNYGNAIIGVVSDNIINFDLKYIFNPTSTGDNSVVGLSGSKFAIAYQNKGGNLNYGTAIIGNIPAEVVIEPEPEPLPAEAPSGAKEGEPTTILSDGDLIRNPNAQDLDKFDIYIVKIVGEQKFKRLILSPHVFESYEHLNWEDVKDVDQSTVNAYTISNLVRAEGDDKVYELSPSGDTGTKQWLNITTQEFVNQGYDSDSIYTINNTDIDSYK